MNNTRKRSKNFQSAFHAAEAMSHDLALQRGKKTPVFEQSGVEGLLSSKDIAAQIKLRWLHSKSHHPIGIPEKTEQP